MIDPSDRDLLLRIEQHLQNLDRRDRWRMISSSLHGVFNLVILATVLWSTWFLYAHTGDIISTVTETMVNQMIPEAFRPK